MTKARRFGPNGDPGSNPAGGSALKRLEQQGHTPPCSDTRVTPGAIRGSSTRSYSSQTICVTPDTSAPQPLHQRVIVMQITRRSHLYGDSYSPGRRSRKTLPALRTATRRQRPPDVGVLPSRRPIVQRPRADCEDDPEPGTRTWRKKGLAK